MAAYAALVSLARLINQILSQDHDYVFLCDKEQMKSLLEKTICLQEFLEYISVRSHSSTIDAFESRIRDVTYQLEYIVESTICKLLDQEFESDTDTQLFPRCTSVAKTFCRRLFSCTGGSNVEAGSYPIASMAPLSVVFLSCTVEINILLEEATEMKSIPVKKYISAAHCSSTTSSSRGAPTTEVNNVGLNNEIAQILDTITGRASNLQIVPITGMGGIGKTTLARAVYDDSRILHHFDARFWVTISQEYDIHEVLRRLLPAEKQSKVPDDRLIEHVYKNLKGRRFLIVLDDIWHRKAWDGVMNAFPDDKKGSRIILTTRELGIASYVCSLSNVHKMQLLNEDQSWSLLREKMYGQEPCPTEFEGIGRTISQNCKGLPLAIVVIAGLLKINKMKDYWKEVAENTIVAAATYYDHLFGILSLSYTNLPPQLKACFLYMGAFQEDYEFRTWQLVMLWTAEGFLKPRESKTMEQIAKECLEELEERNLLLVKKKTYNGIIKTFSIHDVLREMSKRKAKEEKFLHHYSASPVQNIIKDWHIVSFLKNDLMNFQADTYDTHVRSFRYGISLGFRSKWELILWMIDIRRSKEYKLGPLCRITSLRYLHVVNNDKYHRLLKFPKSISKLQNLETLVIEKFGGGLLPSDFWKLSRLRHIVLNIFSTPLFPPLDSQGGDYPVLESLQTLSGLKNTNFSPYVIGRIPNVKKLKVTLVPLLSFDYWQEFSLTNLQHLHQLEELSITCFPIDHKLSFSLTPPTDLAFPRNLKKLSLDGTKIPMGNEYLSVVGLLPNLEVLKMKYDAIVGNIWVPIEGEFLQLKYLKMDLLDIEEWRAESVHFPCLEKLEIKCCNNLKEVPESIGEIYTLHELVLIGCLKAKESVQKMKENQQDFGNDSLKIIIEDYKFNFNS